MYTMQMIYLDDGPSSVVADQSTHSTRVTFELTDQRHRHVVTLAGDVADLAGVAADIVRELAKLPLTSDELVALQATLDGLDGVAMAEVSA